jgi:L-cysteine desulfidase
VAHTVVNTVAMDSGIICDGAGSACSMKVSTSTSAAVKSSLMAINNLRVPQSEGIVSDDVDQTIANLGRLSREGMLDTDIEIINIMRAKQQGKHQ